MTWGLTKETQKGVERWIITRWSPEKKRPERLAVAEYRHIRDNEDELRAYVKRLNAPHAAKVMVSFKHAFINDELLTEYLEFLQTKISTKSVAITQLGYLKKHVINYFVGQLEIMNPNDWQQYQTKWAQYLTSNKAPKAAKTKKDIIIEANRFLGWLAERRPTEIRLKKLEPLTKKRLQTIEAERELRGEAKERQLIEDEDWILIEKKLPANFRAQAMLGYYYGLRLAETMGGKDGDVKKGYLSVERQLRKIDTYGPLKGRMKRKVNHWFSKPADAYNWVATVQQNLMNPITLSRKWRSLMNELGLDYDFHDLRHTYITKAIRLYNPRDVQMAAGHKHISTTMNYLHDDRKMEDETFVPDSEE